MSDDADRGTSGRPRRWLLLLAAFLILAGLAAGGGWYVWSKDLWRPAHWAAGSVPYKAACAPGECRTFGAIGDSHDSGEAAVPVAVLGYDPKIDDEIAQWGDCLQSVADCAYATEGPPQAVLGACVQQSACPAACKSRFAERAAGLEGRALLELYLAMFSGEDGYCTPRGA